VVALAYDVIICTSYGDLQSVRRLEVVGLPGAGLEQESSLHVR
jgi:hypothetical protein